MNSKLVIAGTLVALLTAAAAAQTVTLTLESSKNGQILPPGTSIDWTIKASVSTGDNAGLALVSVDLLQDSNNPAFLDLQPASAVPAAMINFARPLGISNPGNTPPDFGYRGDQRGTAGQMNLVQIGGGQNTFGTAMAPGSGIAESALVIAGSGQSGPLTIAAGTIVAPASGGVYRFRLANGLANTLNSVSPPPVPPALWPVTPATIAGLPTAVITVTVIAPVLCTGDCNCDGTINFADINPFVAALTNPANACSFANCDVNGDGVINFADINPFVATLSPGGPCR